MEKMGQAQVNDVDVLIQNLIKICRPGTAELIGEFLCLIRNFVYGVDMLDLGCQYAEGLRLGRGNSSAAYNGDLQFFHNNLL